MPTNWIVRLNSSGDIGSALTDITAALDHPEERAGQIEMCRAVADAITNETHLVVQAGTGTGKSLAYLLPVVLTGKKTVVATATKALQDQLAKNDLPFLKEHSSNDFSWCVIKGRSNYVCVQRLKEHSDVSPTLDLAENSKQLKDEIRDITLWAENDKFGDISTIDFQVSDAAERAVTVTADECPGAQRCASGSECFAEFARNRAEASDIIVVNTHLYGLHVASDGKILPEHDVVIFDEAHTLEDTISDTVSVNIGPGRVNFLLATLRRILSNTDQETKLGNISATLKASLGKFQGQRLPDPLPVEIREPLLELRIALNGILADLKNITNDSDDVKQRKLRAQTLSTRLAEDIDKSLAEIAGSVAFVEGSNEYPALSIAPLDVAPVLAESLWGNHTAILTSATIPTSICHRVGLPETETTYLSVESPFDYEQNALLYCAAHLPEPNSDQHIFAVIEELESLIRAAGGRTLALFTSYRAMDAAFEALVDRLPYKVLNQRMMSKIRLIEEFSSDENTCLFATAGFFQGIDIPGRTLSLVTIDKIPFPHRNDPLLNARRDELGREAFSQIDLPRATTSLAQAIGRLIRTKSDRGAVAVFDKRLTSSNYAWSIVKALPPMRRTRDRSDIEDFLASIVKD